ncbi:hypothetical protein A7A78_09340 [Aequorivita soesokkakensis]|jgi:uncharacterized protein YdhG (YjbR/CyaY superfamily)|uniref:YdhG-like domain-containing protein n=1 Tax=Aequorivita soesokkakensis TaxID=1385699 RepID=A0A1A9LFH0_9FLAO|nr:DUF1801 domain-containing protein [Aequorivita soesokkakensis]OAD92119.1 hypothetical protein A7A78_09340 [Aequorivita soesokkakensis]
MQSKAITPDQYITELPEDRKEVMQKLRETVKKNLPKGFEETMQYGMISYVVPHSIYPAGYHCKPADPLPFLSIASQKNHIAFYHMGIYSDPNLYKWFTEEYPKHAAGKLDMGKSCIRFKNPKNIPFDLLGELTTKITVEDWISKYESLLKR